MRRLYFQIYLGVVASLALLVGLASLFFHFEGKHSPQNEMLATVREVIVLALPPADAAAARQQEVLERMARPSLPRITLFAVDGHVLAHVGAPLTAPAADTNEIGWIHHAGNDSGWGMRLPDGRWLVAQPQHKEMLPLPFLLIMALIGLVVAIVAYPMAKRLTRRLEALKTGVEALGSGDFSTRVSTRGCDEVASLAKSFNQAAERIEKLLAAHKALLANASHELRSPLTRIRLALEIQSESPSPKLAAEMRLNISELDQLIEEILLAGRLDSMPEPLHLEPVDLAVLVAEESARSNVEFAAERVVIDADSRLLRRLLRNLIENARRHGGDTIKVALSTSSNRTAIVRVCDNGEGIPDSEREKIFAPFYRPAGSREKEGSHGLGLSLVCQIAELHGGNASCYSPAEGGTCFEIRIPLTRGIQSSS
jgi:signal transduction histidine kinase